jgi:hypothetical protein
MTFLQDSAILQTHIKVCITGGLNMNEKQRKMAIVTSLGKKYSGIIDIPNSNFRTSDLFNSANVFWKNPNEKCYDNAILMHDVRLFIDDASVYRHFDKIQIKLSEIIYFYDDASLLGDEMEKKRASTIIRQSQETAQTVNIITRTVGHSFYDITGTFFGMFKKKAKDNFVSLTQANIAEISRRSDKWVKKTISLPHGFIGVNNQHIESITMRSCEVQPSPAAPAADSN